MIARILRRLAKPPAHMCCPLCGEVDTLPFVEDVLICGGCGELLEPGELVKKATPTTRRDYCRRNFGTASYPI